MVPADVEIINWMATSCALQSLCVYMFHNLRKLTHTFWYLPPQLGERQQWFRVQTRLSVPASFWSCRMALTLLCTRKRVRGGYVCECVCACMRGVC